MNNKSVAKAAATVLTQKAQNEMGRSEWLKLVLGEFFKAALAVESRNTSSSDKKNPRFEIKLCRRCSL